uniref:Uncharacterized protein n=1 Tax=Panagrolaimus sp. PS1159 TaxID=55785 RepID=A0AC35FUE3_9BILA
MLSSTTQHKKLGSSTTGRQHRITRAASVASGEISIIAAPPTIQKLKQRQLSEGEKPEINGHRKRLQRLNMPVVYRLYESQVFKKTGVN